MKVALERKNPLGFSQLMSPTSKLFVKRVVCCENRLTTASVFSEIWDPAIWLNRVEKQSTCAEIYVVGFMDLN